jgi:hypothetical protein
MNDAPAAAAPPLSRNARAGGPGQLVLVTPCQDIGEIRTLICGHSHAWSLVQALGAHDFDRAPRPDLELARRLGIAGLAGWGRLPADPFFEQAVALGQSRNFALVWRGNDYIRGFLFAPDPLLDFITTAEPDAAVEPSAVLVPEAAIREMLHSQINEMGPVLAAVGAASGCRRFVIGTPPPLYDGELIRGNLIDSRRTVWTAKKAAMLEGAGIVFETVAITPASIRRKLWLVLQDLLAEAAHRHGAEFVPVPAAAMDAHGCLDPRYALGDTNHANAAYGWLMVRELAARLES